MPAQYNMNEEDDLYRAILEYEYQPTREEPNPHYNPHYYNQQNYHSHTTNPIIDRDNKPWVRIIHVPDGPPKTEMMCIGPYNTVRPIKSFITRNRSRYKNLRIKHVQKVGTWVEVDNV